MRVLIFHGYLLRGTGSNVYNAELGAAFVRGGHEVHMLCQERDPFSLGWVDAVGDWDTGELRVTPRREPVRATVYRPDIGRILPLYVADRYEGFDAKPFQDLTEAELEHYIEANVAAVRAVVERARPDVALANHLVMGPLILARALGDDVPYAVKVHGSDLTFTVGPYPRFRPHAAEGVERARGLLVGSRHTAEQLWGELDDPAAGGEDPARTARRGRGALHARPGGSERPAGTLGGDGADRGLLLRARPGGGRGGIWTRSRPATGSIVYVGKLIATKGVELLLAAFPSVLAREPRARLVIVGFGALPARAGGAGRAARRGRPGGGAGHEGGGRA